MLDPFEVCRNADDDGWCLGHAKQMMVTDEFLMYRMDDDLGAMYDEIVLRDLPKHWTREMLREVGEETLQEAGVETEKEWWAMKYPVAASEAGEGLAP